MVWIQRFAIDTGRASEYVELYQLLGDEVRVVPVSPDLLITQECVDYLLADCKRYAALCTRTADVRESDGT